MTINLPSSANYALSEASSGRDEGSLGTELGRSRKLGQSRQLDIAKIFRDSLELTGMPMKDFFDCTTSPSGIFAANK